MIARGSHRARARKRRFQKISPGRDVLLCGRGGGATENKRPSRVRSGLGVAHDRGTPPPPQRWTIAIFEIVTAVMSVEIFEIESGVTPQA